MKFSSLLFGLVIAIAPLSAIPINNPGFETDVLGCAPGPTCFLTPLGTISGWTASGALQTAVWKPGPQITPAEGIQVLAIGNSVGGATVSQDTGVLVAAGVTYTLSVNVGARTDFPFSHYSIALLAGSTVIAIDGSLTPTPGTMPVDTISNIPLIAGDPLIGQSLSVRLFADGNASSVAVVPAQAVFDNVVLTSSGVPEPSALVLAGLGLIPMFFRRRRS